MSSEAVQELKDEEDDLDEDDGEEDDEAGDEDDGDEENEDDDEDEGDDDDDDGEDDGEEEDDDNEDGEVDEGDEIACNPLPVETGPAADEKANVTAIREIARLSEISAKLGKAEELYNKYLEQKRFDSCEQVLKQLLNVRDTQPSVSHPNLIKSILSSLFADDVLVDSKLAIHVLRILLGRYRKSGAEQMIQPMDNKAIVMRCRKGHALQYAKDVSRYRRLGFDSFNCDVCRRSCGNSPGYTCIPCQYDSCIGCHTEFVEEAEAEQAERAELLKQAAAKRMDTAEEKWAPKSELDPTLLKSDTTAAALKDWLEKEEDQEIQADLVCLYWALASNSPPTDLERFTFPSILDLASGSNSSLLSEALCALACFTFRPLKELKAEEGFAEARANEDYTKMRQLAIAAVSKFPHSDGVAEEAFKLLLLVHRCSTVQNSDATRALVEDICEIGKLRFHS